MKKIIVATCLAASLTLFGCAAETPTTGTPAAGTNTPVTNTTATTQNNQNTASSTASLEVSGTQQNINTVNARDQAAYNAALQLNDASYCDKITITDYKNQCKTAVSDQMAEQEALQKPDASLCEKMSTKDLQDACKIKVEAQIQQQQTAEQQKSQEQAQLASDQKMTGQIISSGDYSRCSELTIYGDQMDCETNILTQKALDNKDITWCDKATLADAKSSCQTTYQKSNPAS